MEILVHGCHGLGNDPHTFLYVPRWLHKNLINDWKYT